MNTLMNALEMPAPAGTEVNRILIIANDSQPEIIKSAYNAAGSLRKAGCIVSVQVDSEDKADFKWLIEVSGKSPDLSLSTERISTTERPTIGEVLKLLGENSGS